MAEHGLPRAATVAPIIALNPSLAAGFFLINRKPEIYNCTARFNRAAMTALVASAAMVAIGRIMALDRLRQPHVNNGAYYETPRYAFRGG